jgi:hypothetical protein
MILILVAQIEHQQYVLRNISSFTNIGTWYKIGRGSIPGRGKGFFSSLRVQTSSGAQNEY